MEQAVADRVSEGGIADEVMPLGNWELAGHDRRAGAMPVVHEFEEVAAIMSALHDMQREFRDNKACRAWHETANDTACGLVDAK